MDRLGRPVLARRRSVVLERMKRCDVPLLALFARLAGSGGLWTALWTTQCGMRGSEDRPGGGATPHHHAQR